MASHESVADQQIQLAESVSHDLAEWEKAAAAVLRKSKKLSDDAPDNDIWAKLTRRTLDGIGISPLGTPELIAGLPSAGLPGQAPYTRGKGARPVDGWDIRAWFTDPDVDRTADHVTTDLENGVNSLWLAVGDGAIPADALARILEPVFLDLAPVVLDAPEIPLEAARSLVAVLTDKAITAHPATNLGLDPIGNAVRGRGVTDLSMLIKAAYLAMPNSIRAIVVDATAVHDEGASDVQELAYSLAAGVAYLRTLVAAGLSIDDAADLIDFRYAATDEQFETIAKFRAARRLWHRVAELSGVAEEGRGQRQAAVTSRPMMSAFDPYVNMLRTTVAAFAAGVGGADSVTVLPFDEPLGLPEPFSRRIARNTSSLLISESHVAKVLDPAGGAQAVEKLTDDLAQAAWKLFGDIDAAGGIETVIASGELASQIADMAEARERLIATRQRPITGLSEFPNLGEERPERRPYGIAPKVRRYGASYEALREEPADKPVFLATMGAVAHYTARATFMSNLLAAGGVAVVEAGVTSGVEDVIAAYNRSGAKVVCLAGTDADYDDWGPDLINALRAAGAVHIMVAGRADIGADVQAAAGLDALEFLRATRSTLENAS